ncbi:ParB/RepB/Spo0J family partition protein [Streptomyces sp. G5(2025)]|uniref:ParB/RepB/Spo0J family partition protein n=1 Tax=Streptomyces sp. G5(2025) TaxID=3406628 RepID=UPI003C21B6DC
MSKADQLGAGRFSATRSISSRRAAIGAATGVPTEGIAPPTSLPVGRISLNPDNPRTSLGDLTELAGSLAEHGQKQAITVMNRDAYVAANPEREKELEPDATYVVVDGSSRLAAAREAGVTHLKVMVDDDQGTDPEAILESALVANIHRQALEPLDEAHALQRLLAIHGTQTALAKRLHKSQGWVSQRLALLKLTPELKNRIGQESVDLLRAVGNKPAEQQEAALHKLKQQQALEQQEKAARRKNKGQQPPPTPKPTKYLVQDSEATPDAADEARERAEPDRNRGVNRVTGGGEGEGVPEPRQASAEGGPVLKKFPYHDGKEAAFYLDQRMDDTQFFAMVDEVNETARRRRAETAKAS